MTIFNRNKSTTNGAEITTLRERLEAVREAEQAVSARRMATMAALRLARQMIAAANNSAVAPLAVRQPLLDEASERFRAAQAADDAAKIEGAAARDARVAAETALAAAVAAVKAGRSDADVRHQLADAEQRLAQRKAEMDKAQKAMRAADVQRGYANDAVGSAFNRAGTSPAERERSTADHERAQAAARAAGAEYGAAATAWRATGDEVAELVAEVDRRSRSWTAPRPVTVPPMPVLTGDVDTDAEALGAYVGNLKRRLDRVGDLMHESQRARDGVRVGTDDRRGVIEGRYQDYEGARRVYSNGLDALGLALQRARQELARVERQPIAV